MIVAALALVLQQAPALEGARHPSYASDGRLAVAVRGDIEIVAANRTRHRITTGPAWDRDPAFTPDGAAIVFASDRGGAVHLWRVAVGPSGAAGQPVRVTGDSLPDAQPTVAADGRVAFVRGRGPSARVWLRAPDGVEKRLTKGDAREQHPAFDARGTRIAYVSIGERASQLRVRILASDSDRVIVGDRRAEWPAWSPDGSRIAFTTASPEAVWVTAASDGRYVNLISSRRAAPAWSPDGRRIALAESPPDEVGFNGDPNRIPDRDAGDELSQRGRLVVIDAPPAVDAGLVADGSTATPAVDRAALNGEIFDRVWLRTASLYYATPDAVARKLAWERMRDATRPRALAAKSDDELGELLHHMLGARPVLRASATGKAAVSSAHPVATAAGLEMLRRGGNVVDAAVGVSFALGVVEPEASGVGGYGQMLVFQQGMTKPALLEFMSRVPEDASLGNLSLLEGGRLPDDGPVLTTVPGTVHGMYTAWQRYGSKKLPWADLLAPAIRAARDGYVVSEGLATTIATERVHFLKYAGSKSLFFPNGRALAAGDTLRNPDLAWTLEQIAKGGADGFYKGEVARRLVTDLRGQGNAMKLADLARYYAAERDAVSGTYRGNTLYSSAPPVSGGASLVAQLNLLENVAAPKPYADDAATLNAMIAAWVLSPSTRNRIADPGLFDVSLVPFLSKDTARTRWRCFSADRAVTPDMVRGDSVVCPATGSAPAMRTSLLDGAANDRECPEPGPHTEGRACHLTGTTAFTVADAGGNIVAVTQTLGTWGGSFYVSPGLGFLYNDKLGSYGTEPGAYGARIPFARHGSTLAPTIVFKGTGAMQTPWFAVGAAGNAWITSAVYQTITGIIDQSLDPQRALELPRFLVGGSAPVTGDPSRRAYTIQLEDGFAPSVLERLRALGYRLQLVSLMGELREGYGAAVVIGPAGVTAGADPRRAGSAGAIEK
ncbi:MAG: gamma-glutamyltransferase [Gemmatimonadaceae bacterium]